MRRAYALQHICTHPGSLHSTVNVNLMGYADDHTAYSSFPATSRSQESYCMENLQACLEEVRTWMSENRLKMNDTKTEAILFGNEAQLKKCLKVCDNRK